MICDLLSQAGISARVDGEFLQAPVANCRSATPSRCASIRRVPPRRARSSPTGKNCSPSSRCRSGDEDIALQIAAVVLRRARWWACGVRHRAAGHRSDGRASTTTATDATTQFVTTGGAAAHGTLDRNDDGYVDARWIFDVNGVELEYDADDDFDGEFEWRADVEDGEVTRSVLDADGDGRPEQVRHFRNGVLEASTTTSPAGVAS